MYRFRTTKATWLVGHCTPAADCSPSSKLLGGILDQADYLGFAPGGEVEDYMWNFGPNAVTLRDLQATALSIGERLMQLLQSLR